uniref:Carboxylesterase type B domain-containing protein n=1 Tax=Strongyloides stercoralis TaxID=6248 RepID=A0AAF5CQN6_STRER
MILVPIIFIIITFLIDKINCSDNFLIREISNGKILGTKQYSSNGKIYGYAFRGIPYGLPPIGSLRFKAPLEPKNWSNIKDCTTFKKMCPFSSHFINITYNSEEMSEDCLYLNVYTSKKCLINNDCPVVLYIYGGKYVTGSVKNFNETTLIENFANNKRGIVFVNFNFRSGILGYLVLNQKFNLSMDSNVALHDTISALKWIKKNIISFGGDKNHVTLMGHSSGGVMTSYLYASPRTDGLIHKVIIMSAPHFHVYFKNANEFFGRQTAILAGCANIFTNWNSIGEIEKILDCLRKLDISELSKYDRKVQYNCWQYMGPSSDYGPYSVMQYNWEELSKNKRNIPILIGNGMYELQNGMYLLNSNGSVDINKLKLYCHIFFMYFKFDNPQKFIEECVEEYKNDKLRTIEIADELGIFLSNIILSVDGTKRGSNVFLYQFSYKKEGEAITKQEFILTPNHVSELIYVIGLNKNNFKYKDYKIQESYSRMFTNFIKYSNPSDNEIVFEKFNPKKNNYYHIDFNDNGDIISEMKNNYNEKAINFWLEKIPNKVGSYTPRTSEEEFIKILPIQNEIDKQYVKDIIDNFLHIRKTNYGFVKGYGFYSIPYASPPIGERRFKAPLPPKKWNNIRNSTEFDKSCIWNSARTTRIPNNNMLSEDCLFINIFSGENCLIKGNCSVLLYLHGGKYTYGDSNSLNSEMMIENFVSRDIVVCTINFRLGFLGFSIFNYNLHNLTMNSNVALFDILESLKWINSEIKYFGGNNSDVTVMGHSSGGVINNFLYYSKRTNNLIHKHIIMSGPVKYGHFQDGNQMYSRKIAITCGCAYNTTNWNSTSDVEGVLKCLRSIDAKKIVNSQKFVEETGIDIFSPTFDKGINSFLQFDIDYLIKTKPKRELLIGNTLYEFVEDNLLILCKYLCSLFDFTNNTLAIDACMMEYGNEYYKVLDMTSDVNVFLGNLRQCYENYNNDIDAYLYQFNYDNVNETLDTHYKWLPQHASDIVYITGQHRETFSKVDYIVQEKYSRMFANFIKNSTPSDSEIIFDKFDPTKNNYYIVDFDKNGTMIGGMENNYRKDAVKFWNEKLVNIVGHFESTLHEDKLLKIYPDVVTLTSNVVLKNFTYPKSYYNNNSTKNISSNNNDLKNSPENATDTTFYIIGFMGLFMALIYILIKNCKRPSPYSYQYVRLMIQIEKSSKSNKTIINILSHNATSFYPKILSIPISRYDNQKQLENRLNPVDIITIVGVGLVIFLIIVVCNFKS